MGNERRPRTDRDEEGSPTNRRPRVPVDRSPERPRRGDRTVPPAKGHGTDRGGPPVPGLDRAAASAGERRGPGPGPTAFRASAEEGSRSGFRAKARALAERISGEDDPDGAEGSAGAREADPAGDPERRNGEDGNGNKGEEEGLGATLQERFPELDTDGEDLKDVQWRNVAKKAALAEAQIVPGVRGAVAGADELHQQLSKGDPLDDRIPEIRDRLGEYPPPEGWTGEVAERVRATAGPRFARPRLGTNRGNSPPATNGGG